MQKELMAVENSEAAGITRPPVQPAGYFANHQRKHMKILALILAKIIGTVLAADFVGGFVHWLEDAYVREDTPVIGKAVARPKIVHHHFPRFMTRFNWWFTSRDL